MPIIQWIDRTKISGNDRFSLKPYTFTPAIFTEKFRRSIKAWGYHGFLPKNTTSSTAQNAIKKQGDKMRNYHQELEAVLTTFRESGPRLKGIILPIGSQGFIRVDIVTCVLFIIQDMQEGDQLCGRYGPHGPSIHRHSRSCNVSFQDLENWKTKCFIVILPLSFLWRILLQLKSHFLYFCLFFTKILKCGDSAKAHKCILCSFRGTTVIQRLFA